MGNTDGDRKDLVKHVGAIHAAHSASLLQRKINNSLLYNAYPELIKKETHSIKVRELAELCGFNSKDTATLKKSLISLRQIDVQWNIINPDTGKEQWGTAGLISEAVIEDGICYYSYSPALRKLLYAPQMYAKINMGVQASFKSGYGLALYENCIRYKNIAQTPWIDINTLRGLLGVKSGKYRQFKNFKSRVLDKAVEEVNARSGFSVSYEIRKSKSGDAKSKEIKFVMSVDKQIGGSLKTERKLEQVLSKDYGLTNFAIKDLIESYSQNYLEEKIKYVEKTKSAKKGQIRNLGAYLMAVIKNDYTELYAKDPVVLENNKTTVLSVEAKEALATQVEIHIRTLDQDELEQYNNEFTSIINSIYGHWDQKSIFDPIALRVLSTKLIDIKHKIVEEVQTIENNDFSNK